MQTKRPQTGLTGWSLFFPRPGRFLVSGFCQISMPFASAVTACCGYVLSTRGEPPVARSNGLAVLRLTVTCPHRGDVLAAVTPAFAVTCGERHNTAGSGL